MKPVQLVTTMSPIQFDEKPNTMLSDQIPILRSLLLICELTPLLLYYVNLELLFDKTNFVKPDLVASCLHQNEMFFNCCFDVILNVVNE